MSDFFKWIDLEWIARWLWALVVLFLPITSFRFFPFLGKETMVRPLSFYPLILLLIVLGIRLLRREIKPRLNGAYFLLGLLIAIAFAATLIGAVYVPVPMHGATFWARTMRAWVTLAGGLAFLAGTTLMNQNEEDIKFTLKWLYIGLAANIIWGGIQMFSYLTKIPGRSNLNKIQLLFSIRALIAQSRVSGFAYEPSWLASQLATVYIPWLFGSILSGYRIFKRRWLEPLIFAGAIALLLCSYSRGGILMTAGTCSLVLLLTQGSIFKRFFTWFFHLNQKGQTSSNRGTGLVTRIGLILVVCGLAAGVVWFLSRNFYFAKIWQSNKSNFTEYIVDIYAGPRLAYAVAAWDVFQAHPVTGVGLGAAGLYMYEYIPQWARTTLSEVSRQLVYNAFLYPNAKNIFIRFLAETGLVGFGIYLAFLLNVLGQIIHLGKIPDRFSRMLFITGLTTWIVLIFFNFTQDSLIDPDEWFSLAILLALSVNILPALSKPGRTGNPVNHSVI
jgi:O-antigen ligase